MSHLVETSMLRAEVEAYLYHEARLMDESRYAEWEALWTDDAVYWVPCNEDDYDPSTHISLIYDDRYRIAQRVAKLASGQSHSQDPPSRMRRVISNVEIEVDADPAAVRVLSNFMLAEVRNDFVLWAGQTTHVLRSVEGQIRMTFKKVCLVNNDRELPPLGFLI
jgi:benzoate/toluate 1,2-dioxygenase beta subunit